MSGCLANKPNNRAAAFGFRKAKCPLDATTIRSDDRTTHDVAVAHELRLVFRDESACAGVNTCGPRHGGFTGIPRDIRDSGSVARGNYRPGAGRMGEDFER